MHFFRNVQADIDNSTTEIRNKYIHNNEEYVQHNPKISFERQLV